jgi:hypothetical protein
MAATAPHKATGRADIMISLSYRPDGLIIDPPLTKVEKGQTIAFRLKEGPSGGKVRITFRNKRYFSKPVFNEGDAPVLVKRTLAGRTVFDCDLVLSGKLQRRKDGQKGGELERNNPI